MLPAHYKKEGPSYFCRFTFGQFFTLLVLEIFTLFFIFYLGARYGRELFGLEVKGVTQKESLPEITTTDEKRVATTSDPEIRALAKDILESAPTSDLKTKVEEMLKGSGPKPQTTLPSVIATMERPKAVIQTVPPDARFSIQVGSYPNTDEAHLMLSRWKQKGYQAYLVSADIPGKGRWYRVRLGSFQTKEEASDFLKSFQQKEGVEAFIASNF